MDDFTETAHTSALTASWRLTEVVTNRQHGGAAGGDVVAVSRVFRNFAFLVEDILTDSLLDQPGAKFQPARKSRVP